MLNPATDTASSTAANNARLIGPRSKTLSTSSDFAVAAASLSVCRFIAEDERRIVTLTVLGQFDGGDEPIVQLGKPLLQHQRQCPTAKLSQQPRDDPRQHAPRQAAKHDDEKRRPEPAGQLQPRQTKVRPVGQKAEPEQSADDDHHQRRPLNEDVLANPAPQVVQNAPTTPAANDGRQIGSSLNCSLPTPPASSAVPPFP